MVPRGTTSQTFGPTIRLCLVVLALAVLIGLSAGAQTAMAQDAQPTCNPAGDDNDRLYCVWIAEPRFGGFNVDDSDPSTIRVWLTGDEPAGDTAARVLAEVNLLWGRQFTSTSVDEADYTIGQLKGWFDLVAANRHPSIVVLDLDESTNRVAVGTSDTGPETLESVAAHISSLKIPPDALSIAEHGAMFSQPWAPHGDPAEPDRPDRGAEQTVPASPQEQRLDRGLAPFVGGGKISSSGVGCSAGFVVRFVDLQGDWENGFVTAGHCGDAGTEFVANDIDGIISTVGVSTTNLFEDNIDAQYVGETTTSDIEFGIGQIARPMEKNTSRNRATGNRNKLDQSQPHFEIVQHGRPAVGDTVHKVGDATGWASGLDTRTCLNARISYPTGPRTLACVDEASYIARAGDSGGPVFSINPDGKVTLHGIVIGSGGVIFPVDQILKKLFTDSGINQVWVTDGTDFDVDDDGLIEVSNLSQLDAMRWDLDGDGSSNDPRYLSAFVYPAAEMGCGSDRCTGYELTVDVDFDDNASGSPDAGDAHWNHGAGWNPIGSSTSGADGDAYDALFDGNGHVIANLFIDRSDANGIGLFDSLGGGASIKNVGLFAADITGGSDVGGLAGKNSGRISSVYVTGSISGAQRVGGLVGHNITGRISASYSTSGVTGERHVGGFAGASTGGHIIACYSTGTVAGDGDVGGLVGSSTDTTTRYSYWDTENSGQRASSGGSGKTTSAMSSPTDYSGIYANWDVDLDGDGSPDRPWNFGNSGQYPTLVLDVDNDGMATWQEFGEQERSGDYDHDNDGDIEVSDLLQLNALRWDLDGNGASDQAAYAQAFPNADSGMGCPDGGCQGYELTTNLDFDTDGNGRVDAGDAFWNDGSGWSPIGSAVDEADDGSYQTRFDGNGHLIANLLVHRSNTDTVGLFRSLGDESFIVNLGLPDADIMGGKEVGALAGASSGAASLVFVTGNVNGDSDVGGLVGYSVRSDIAASYATSNVSGDYSVGGLVGFDIGSRIIASYFVGRVSGESTIGGLVGLGVDGTITTGYAVATVVGEGYLGGLVAEGIDATVTDSYWDIEVSGLTTSAGGVGKTTHQFQSETGYTGIYGNWNVDLDDDQIGDDPWDFGLTTQYPVLKVDFDGNGTATSAEFGDQRPLPNPPTGLTAIAGDGVVKLTWTAPAGDQIDSDRYEYHVEDGTLDPSASWTPIAGGTDATSVIVTNLKNGQEYVFRVRAVNILGTGPASDPVTATPLPRRPNQPIL